MEIAPKDYSDCNQFHKRDAKDTINEILQDGLQNKIKLILDVGCGNGDVTRMLAQAFPSAKILAFDILPSMVLHSKAQLSSEERDRIDFVVQDFCAEFHSWNKKIICVEGKVDLIWSTYALHYAPLHKRPEIARTLSRLLRPGGRLYLNFLIARDFLPFLPPKLQEYCKVVSIPGLETQKAMWRSCFENMDVPVSSFNINVLEKEWHGLKDDSIFKLLHGSRTFINFFRPFIQEDLPEFEKDTILNNCTKFAFYPTLFDVSDGHKLFLYDCVQLRGMK